MTRILVIFLRLLCGCYADTCDTEVLITYPCARYALHLRVILTIVSFWNHLSISGGRGGTAGQARVPDDQPQCRQRGEDFAPEARGDPGLVRSAQGTFYSPVVTSHCSLRLVYRLVR